MKGMKKSEFLKESLLVEENDSKAFGIGTKIIREERTERFDENWLFKFKDKFKDDFRYIEKMFCWRLMDDKKNNIDFYPKANKVFIHSKNKWIKPGLDYLIKTYFDENK